MTQPIDTAYVDLEARGEDQAARDIAQALNKIAAEVKKLTTSIEKNFAQAGKEMEQEVDQATRAITRDLEKPAAEAKKTGTTLALAFKEASESAKKSVDDLADAAVRDMDRIEHAALKASAAAALAGSSGGGGSGGGGGGGSGGIGIGLPGNGRRNHDIDGISDGLRGISKFADDARKAISNFVDTIGGQLANGARKAVSYLSELGSTISSIVGPIFSLISGLGILGIALALTPVLIPLIAALSQLSGLMLMLPGTIAVLAAAVAPLIISFQGIGDAVSALASGDLKKIDAAMQNLSPNARKFAVEIFNLRDELKKLRMSVQDAFFAQFNGSMTELGKFTLPVLSKGLSDVAGSLGSLGHGFADLLSSNDILDDMKDVFAATKRIIDDLSPKIIDMFGVLFGAIEHSMPFVERFFKAVGGGMEKFTDWLSEALSNGNFEKWLENAFTITKELWGLLQSIGRLFGAIFGGTADDGKDFIQILTQMVDKLTAFFSSPEGKDGMQKLIEGFKAGAKNLVTLVEILSTVIRWLDRLQTLFGNTVYTVKLVASAFKALWDGIGSAVKTIGSTVSSWFKSVGDWFSSLWHTVLEKGADIINWFQSLPGKIASFITSIPGIVVNAFKSAFDQTLYEIGFATGLIVKFMIDLPKNIAAALAAVVSAITTTFTTAKNVAVNAVTSLFNTVVDFFSRLPGRVSRAVSAIVDSVTKWFRSTRDSTTHTTSSLVDTVIKFFKDLPGRAANAISSLPGKIRNILNQVVSDALRIGHNIMDGIANGIRNGTNAAINAAKDAAKHILKGFWDALDIGSPSKVTADRVGKPIMQGVGVGVEDEEVNIKKTINASVTRTVSSANATATQPATQGTTTTAATTTAQGAAIVIENLTIPINGTFDFTDPATSRAVAMKIFEAIENLKREYR